MSASSSTPALVEPLVRQLYGLGQVRREISRHAHLALDGQGFGALAAIHRSGSLRVSDVAAHLAIDLSVASRQVAALARAGYVQRERDAADGRAHLVSCTGAGERVLSDSHARMVDAFQTAVADWPAGDLRALTQLLERLITDFAAMDDAEQETS